MAGGDPLVGECPPEFGHAAEARLNAEDADNGFAPAPGNVQLLEFPLGSGIRVDRPLRGPAQLPACGREISFAHVQAGAADPRLQARGSPGRRGPGAGR
ncbi:MAG: hypothetical protein GX610_10565 [Rhodococcus sp.]|nr:hypothetical protein [Rhodococcus sp. (in: high G+C Gram-positive bacteria)]